MFAGVPGLPDDCGKKNKECKKKGIAGGHVTPVSSQYWRVGCLGITETCTTQCEESFLKCIAEKEEPVYARDLLENFGE